DMVVAVPFHVDNIADASLWSDEGIAPVEYTMSIDGPFTVDGQVFDVESSSSNLHDVMLVASETGHLEATLTIVSDCPERPVLEILVTAEVRAVCDPDLNGDGELDIFDVFTYLALFEASDAQADWNGDTIVDVFDVLAFLGDLQSGC
ncbi:MAG: hypothetical protein KDA28_00760, partial [Phycisphaerales bacterium]|nr:hypothetical protein [Phycisphaerales bacterium]